MTLALVTAHGLNEDDATKEGGAGLSPLVIIRGVQRLTEGRSDVAFGADRSNRMIQPSMPTPNIPVARTEVARPSTRPERRYRLVIARKKPVNVNRA